MPSVVCDKCRKEVRTLKLKEGACPFCENQIVKKEVKRSSDTRTARSQGGSRNN